jgi:UDP-N-acetylglucosamine 2-epimerase
VTSPTRKPIAILFGTRPEAIKLAPVILELRRRGTPLMVATTGQHRGLVDGILSQFAIDVDEDLNLMRPEQSLDYVLAHSLTGIGEALDRFEPCAVVVQGDTTSSLAASLAAFHRHLPLAHVEAGLRSHHLNLPFPEELNRRVTSMIATWHFAPTAESAANLHSEGVSGGIFVTGNTVVDALQHIVATSPSLPERVGSFVRGQRYVLATAHRRESWHRGIAEVASALSDVLTQDPNLRLVFVTHPNPVARGPVSRILGVQDRALVLDALDYPAFVELLRGAALAVTDSGGIQEEGPTLGVPVLVTRDVTERPEGVEAGAVRVIGTEPSAVRESVMEVLRDRPLRERMSAAGRRVYGDGHAAERIVDVMLREAVC